MQWCKTLKIIGNLNIVDLELEWRCSRNKNASSIRINVLFMNSPRIQRILISTCIRDKNHFDQWIHFHQNKRLVLLAWSTYDKISYSKAVEHMMKWIKY